MTNASFTARQGDGRDPRQGKHPRLCYHAEIQQGRAGLTGRKMLSLEPDLYGLDRVIAHDLVFPRSAIADPRDSTTRVILWTNDYKQAAGRSGGVSHAC